MTINYLLIIFILMMLACALRGAQKGMIRILFGLISWIFLVCFVNYGSVKAEEYITDHTQIPSMIQEHIDEHLHDKYKTSEEKEAGTGEEAVLSVVPEKIKDNITDTIKTSIDNLILFVAQELTAAAIKGISTILTVIVGILLIALIDRLLKAVGFVPGIKDVNKTLGFVGGALQGLIITWFAMYLANCFPSSTVGEFIVSNSQSSKVLNFVYQNNLIEKIIGK